MARAEEIPFIGSVFDGVVASQVLHEVKQFASKKTLSSAVAEIARVLSPGGRALILDFLCAPQGKTTLRMSPDMRERLSQFASKFKHRKIYYKLIPPDMVELQNQDLTDFLSKSWALDVPGEQSEMHETHSVFDADNLVTSFIEVGLTLMRWEPFQNLNQELKNFGLALVEGKPWELKFMGVFMKR